METKEALDILSRALDIAAQKGAFNLQDSAAVYTALTVVKQATTSDMGKVEDVAEEKKK